MTSPNENREHNVTVVSNGVHITTIKRKVKSCPRLGTQVEVKRGEKKLTVTVDYKYCLGKILADMSKEYQFDIRKAVTLQSDSVATITLGTTQLVVALERDDLPVEPRTLIPMSVLSKFDWLTVAEAKDTSISLDELYI